jgi:hypothetical protein
LQLESPHDRADTKLGLRLNHIEKGSSFLTIDPLLARLS